MQLKYLLPVALAGSALASSKCSGDVQATGQGDLDNISGCSTYNGDITITGSGLGAQVTLNGIKTLEGNLVIKNVTQLNGFSAPVLEEITESFTINVATVLNNLAAPQLTKVGSINWVTLPALNGLNFDKTITNASSIVISDTGLNTLNGINVLEIGTFNINNNNYLNDVSVDVSSVSDSLDISFNTEALAVSLPYLVWANNMTFRDVGSISLPNITLVNSSVGFINNTINGLEVPKLTSVGGSLAIVSNSKLSNVSFPQLSEVGGALQVANNTNLNSILGFPKVKSVGGAIDFQGDFDYAQLNALNLVKGGVYIDSSSDKFSCNSWNKLHSNGDIHGDSYVCKAKAHSTSVNIDDSGSDASGSGSATAAASTSSSKGGAIAIKVQQGSVLGLVAGLVFQLL
ncbi:cell wall protein Ecm33p [Trichomonascus vanleenenianus]|uniref:Sps22p n=1 Tax=Trichomonascus vanleenenianus TaxID=2268995 RepID=UPI003EC99FD0